MDVLKDGAPASLGGTVMAYVKRPDGSITASMSTVTNNRCEVTLGSYDFGIAGYVYAVLRYTDSQTHATVTLDAIAFNVQSVEGNRIIDKDGVLPETIDQLLNEIETMREATKAANDAADHANEVADGLEEITLETQRRVLAAFPTDTASGELVSIPDGADNLPIKQMQVDIEPVQDLHGYDCPWPGGGGKNLLNRDGQTTTHVGVTYSFNDDGTILVDGTATDLSYVTVGHITLNANTEYILSGGYSARTYLVVAGHGTWRDIGSGVSFTPTETLNAYVQAVVLKGETVSNITLYPMIRLASETDATFEPYSNICPITGWTGANIDVRGKNLLKFNISGSRTVSGIRFDINADGSITINGTSTAGKVFMNLNYSANVKAVPLGVQYKLLCGTPSPAVVLQVMSEAGIISSNNGLTVPSYFAIPSDANANATWIRVQVPSIGTTLDNVTIYPMWMAADETDYTFEPYQTPHEYNVQFPTSAGTVYGGTLTINEDGSGKLVVDKKSVNMGALSFTAPKEGGFQVNLSDGVPGVTEKNKCEIFACDSSRSFRWADFDSLPDNTVYKAQGYNMIYIKAMACTTLQSFISAVSGYKFVYPLATPVIYNFSAEQVTSLLGTNNISADTGEIITLDYRADVTKYIAKKLAEH